MRWVAWISVVALIAGYTLLIIFISPKKAPMDRVICTVILAVNAWLLTLMSVWLRP